MPIDQTNSSASISHPLRHPIPPTSLQDISLYAQTPNQNAVARTHTSDIRDHKSRKMPAGHMLMHAPELQRDYSFFFSGTGRGSLAVAAKQINRRGS
jgi:hypothetical protein